MAAEAMLPMQGLTEHEARTRRLTQGDELWARQIFESYTGVAFGSAGYGNAVATVLAQGSVSIFISWTACLLILFLEPPSRFFLGWRNEVSPDKRPALLALTLFLGFWMIWSYDPLGYYFGILVKPFVINSILMALVVVWFFVVRAIWRARLFERFLGLNTAPRAPANASAHPPTTREVLPKKTEQT